MEENEQDRCAADACGLNCLALRVPHQQTHPKNSPKSPLSPQNSQRTESKPTEDLKNIIQDRQKQQILILCTDLKDKHLSKHVIDSAIALRNNGHKITMITTAFDMNQFSENLAKIAIVQVGCWIPSSIKGLFPHFLYFLRSLYSTIFMIRHYRKIQPQVSVVFCETNCFMIPIIKYFTRYKVVYFQYIFQLAQYRLPASELCLQGSLLRNYCLLKADRILVPNQVFSNIYKRSFSNQIVPYVCEPYLNVRSLRNEKVLPINHVIEGIYEDTLIFVVLAEYHPRSNLELALDAFQLLVRGSGAAAARLRLVVAGHAGHACAGYVRRLAARARRLQLGGRALLHPRPSRRHRRALLAGSVALLHCCEQGLWDRYVLEAMALGCAVIATDSGFAAGALEHGVTGYVVPATPDCFAAAMGEMLANASKADFLARMARCEFLRRYSLEAYGARLAAVLRDLALQDSSPLYAPRNQELFFG